MNISKNKNCNIRINNNVISNKSAKEMFKELGYKYEELFFEEKLDEIYYLKSGRWTSQVKFSLNHKCVTVYRENEKEVKQSSFDIKLLSAINKQVEELGWLEQEQTK